MDNVTQEQMRAAYALNLCTVSISQIIDYNDINVLEQEYEAILNNLNLERMPKDEALLSIIKQILDTVTFFRIQEGDKKVIDMEYQHKMKNAIWSAVPNIGLLVAGGSIVTMAISLASQVGIGYMNYRQHKAEYQLEREKEYWQLQRSAIEQFNGLRRELFDTAWRLADAYKFPDQLRLTERQISQYNQILMDQDLLRKYERLDTIKEKFEAYPPFWYHFGSTANKIYRSKDLGLEKSDRDRFKDKAIECFARYEKYFDLENISGPNSISVLREDVLTSAWALEYIDLLDAKENQAQITRLLKTAVYYSGNANDVLELCALAYLKNGNYDQAAKLLRILVNEDYNPIVNAQLLSRIYVGQLKTEEKAETKSNYRLLAQRVAPNYLYPLPEAGTSDEDYIKNQGHIVVEEYHRTINAFINRCIIRFNKILPAPGRYAKPDSYFDNSEESEAARYHDAEAAFKYDSEAENYLSDLCSCGFRFEYVSLLNEMVSDLCKLQWLNASDEKWRYILHIKNKLNRAGKGMEKLEREMEQGCKSPANLGGFSIESFRKLQEYSFEYFTEEFFNEFSSDIVNYILTLDNQKAIDDAEYALLQFCRELELPSPVIVSENNNDTSSHTETVYISMQTLGKDALKEKQKKERIKELLQIIKRYAPQIISNSPKSKTRFLLPNDGLNDYLTSSDMPQNMRKSDILAAIDDSSKKDMDLVFTVEGIFKVGRGKASRLVEYGKITDKSPKCIGLIWPDVYSNPDVNMKELYKLIDNLKKESDSKNANEQKNKPNLTDAERDKCNAIIHSASVAAGGVGSGMAQLPLADNAIITPIQIAMIIGLGEVFNRKLTKSAATAILTGFSASIAGRAISQAAVGWIPGIGNAVNTATAVGITETIGWMAVAHFKEEQDKSDPEHTVKEDPEEEPVESFDKELKEDIYRAEQYIQGRRWDGFHNKDLNDLYERLVEARNKLQEDSDKYKRLDDLINALYDSQNKARKENLR